MVHLSSQQLEALEHLQKESLFLEGPAGCGKTTTGVQYLSYLVNSGIHAGNILVLTPQRSLAAAYRYAYLSHDFPAGGQVNTLTIGGLARRMLNLFWPMIAKQAGFASPHLPPVFLSLETAQYFAAKVMEPLLDQGYFDSITIERNRIYSQVLDNLNKSAVTGFPLTEIGARLKAAWVGKPEQLRVYDEMQECAILFRQYCLANNLLDFSVQLEVFTQHLWQSFLFRQYFFREHQYLIYDNVEEDMPIAHDLVMDWLPHLKNFLLIYDSNGGYRSFLGADPANAFQLRASCQRQLSFESSFVMTEQVQHLGHSLLSAAQKSPFSPERETLQQSLVINHHAYMPEMVEWVCREVQSLIEQQEVEPQDICILSPFLSDSLRFSFLNILHDMQIPVFTHRPSRSLKDEPATHCLLTTLALIHPQWGITPSNYDFRSMLVQTLADFDLIRADVFTRIVYRPQNSAEPLGSFDHIRSDMQDRITFSAGERYERWRDYILRLRESAPLPLDYLISKLFGEILSQPGYGFHREFTAAETCARLIDAFQNFQQVVVGSTNPEPLLGKEFIDTIRKGILAAQYLPTREDADRNAVFIAPAYTFLMSNRPVRYQFWLDVGSLGWWERLHQPLTHPVVLSRQWKLEQKWTDSHEHAHNLLVMQRLVDGLLHRCRDRVYACISSVNEQGMEMRGPLFNALNSITRRMARMGDPDV